MTDENIEATIFDIVARESQVERDSLKTETVLADLNIESLDMVQILFGIEEEFDVYVPPEEVENLKTMGDVVAGVKQLMADKPDS